MQTVTYKYRIKDRSAKKTLVRLATACNQVWNYCNAQQRDVEARYKAGAPKRKWATHFDLAKLCNGVGEELGLIQGSVRDVCRQYATSRDKAHHSLKFRSSFGAKRALGWVPFQQAGRFVEGNSVVYNRKRYRFFEGKRPVPETAKGGMFVEDALGRWWVCFVVEVADRQPVGNGEVGIDLGLKSLATMSDGQIIEAPRVYRSYEEKLAVAQRAGHKNQARRIHAKIANCRKDFLHKVTTKLAGQNALIAVGNVNSKQLAQTSMAKSVLDAGWSAFRQMLAYKSPGYVEVDEKFTTQTCSTCGTLPSSRPKGIAGLGVREWVCSSCGESHDRDVNAARNILSLARGLPRPVAGSPTKSRVKTDPVVAPLVL